MSPRRECGTEMISLWNVSDSNAGCRAVTRSGDLMYLRQFSVMVVATRGYSNGFLIFDC